MAAVCTPDFFGFDADLMLRYRGRIEAPGGSRTAAAQARRELFEAMRQVAETGQAPAGTASEHRLLDQVACRRLSRRSRLPADIE